ncbi:homoserine dehydrogenase [Fibrobacterota bacterium]
MKLKIGIIGVGTVGAGAVELIRQHREFFSSQLGFDIDITGACAKTMEELEAVPLPANCKKILHPQELCTNPDVDIVLELAGGYEEPRSWITTALNNKKHVITANKALLAKYGSELFPLAAQNNCFLMFEAAVGGGIPIIKTLQESLIANDILGLACIINGTCNYILSKMSSDHQDFGTVLEKAQELGYAEADPSFDVEGTDSAHKIALLASLCFGKYVDFEEMRIEGITSISKLDVEMAREMGFVIKLLGIVSNLEGKGVSANVYPALLKPDHQLASVNGVLNAVYLKSSAAGQNLLTGPGAGRFPTASSVIADLISIGRYLQSGAEKPYATDFINPGNKMKLVSIDELETEFYLRITTRDEPGVLAQITSILAKFNISIDSILQKPAGDIKSVPIIILTHRIKNKLISEALAELDKLDVVTCPTQVLRFYS